MKQIYLGAAMIMAVGVSQAQNTDRLVLIEGLSSNTCGPCASFNSQYSPVLSNNNANDGNTAGVAVVKYQMDWPSPGTDPSFNDDGDARRGFYGTTGIPDWFIDGEFNDGSQSIIDTRSQVPAEIMIDAAYSISGSDITVDVEFTALEDLGAGNRLFIALCNSSYSYTGGTNGESSFKHIFRKMLPSGAGVFLSPIDSGDVITHSETYTFNVASGTPTQGSYDLWNSNIEVVVWVQKTTGSKPVYNAAVATEGALSIEEGDSDDFALVVFPNPTTSHADLLFDANGKDNVVITVTDATGKLVQTENLSGVNGRQRHNLNTDALSNGLYFVSVKQGNQVANTKLLVQK